MVFTISDTGNFIQQALQYACKASDHVFFLGNNGANYRHGTFPKILTFGAHSILKPVEGLTTFEVLKTFHKKALLPIFGFFTYDLKNEIEPLVSNHPDFVGFPDSCFIEPEVLIRFDNNEIEITSHKGNELQLFNAIMLHSWQPIAYVPPTKIHCRFTREEYIQQVKLIQQHILRGDIYELNFCTEFYIPNILIDPVDVFLKLHAISPNPFAAFVKHNGQYALCASPERFLKKSVDDLISQPIKGTIKRGATQTEDDILKASLSNSEKERAENVMIVDLVRNDLSHTAKDGSVTVDELFGIYTFEQVHQMISTVKAKQSKSFHFTDTLQNCFPMGSMTGAPKISAMKLIEHYERTKRGLFSGAIGYITPSEDFDFNVVIRSILYNAGTGYLSFQAGSAITSDADPVHEWEECAIKTRAIREVLYKVQ